MAKTILRNASVVVNSVDLSNHVRQVTITETWDQVDVTAMGDSAKSYLLGLADATIAVEFYQDFAAASVDVTLAGLAGSNTPFPVVVKADAGAVSATNPTYTMQAVLPQYSPVAGQVGAASLMTVTFHNASNTGIVRATS